MSITWQQPPERGRSRAGRPNKYDAIFAQLRVRPDEWAKIAEGQANGSQTTRLRRLFPGSEVVSRRNESGRYDLFARYPIGPRAKKSDTITPATADPDGPDDADVTLG